MAVAASPSTPPAAPRAATRPRLRSWTGRRDTRQGSRSLERSDGSGTVPIARSAASSNAFRACATHLSIRRLCPPGRHTSPRPDVTPGSKGLDRRDSRGIWEDTQASLTRIPPGPRSGSGPPAPMKSPWGSWEMPCACGPPPGDSAGPWEAWPDASHGRKPAALRLKIAENTAAAAPPARTAVNVMRRTVHRCTGILRRSGASRLNSFARGRGSAITIARS
jgi:hypothetical protein